MKALVLPLSLVLFSCTSTKERPDVIPYERDTCVVMDSKLGAMGDPIVRVYDGREVKFCCQPCVEEFEADPEFYLEQLDASTEAPKEDSE